jgi:hypothetical protein
MPTGYTADIPKGISFKTFALNCARAFGACVMLRDEPGGGEAIPERLEPSDYHAKKLDGLRAELEAVAKMTDQECLLAHVAEWDEGERYRLAKLDEVRREAAAYTAMLEQVQAWTPPSGHERFKAFMVEQLETTLKYDGDTSYYENPAPKLNALAWREQRETKIARDIIYHERENAAEIERTNGRNAWLQALRSSLPEG